jgi:hypothetical protein
MLEKEKRSRYLQELGGATVLYFTVLYLAIYIGRQMEDSAARTMLLVSPMVPIALIVWVIVRAIRRADEYVRLRSLETFAISAAVTAGWTLTYGFLETAGFPRLSMFTVWPIMSGVWLIVTGVRWLTAR